MKVGDNEVKDILIGDTQVLKVYRGEDVVWEKSVSPLPSGYRQVEYLQSSGTQWINTLVTPDTSTGIYMDFQVLQMSGAYAVGMFHLNNFRFCPLVVRINKIQYEAKLSPQTFIDYGNFDTNRHSVYYNYDNDLKVLYDGVEKEAIGSLGTSSTFAIYLFSRNNNGVVNGTTPTRFYNVRLKKQGDIVRNFIPCLDTNNTPCMFDLVTRQPFYNQGTGTFGYETMDGTIVSPT